MKRLYLCILSKLLSLFSKADDEHEKVEECGRVIFNRGDEDEKK